LKESIQNKLLTIAIPTWNRATILDTALQQLIPQVEAFKNDIQFVISDNASTDNTKEIVQKYLDKYTDLSILYYRQKENKGFFGNFSKVKELSTGNFIWILSDDDHVADGFIQKLIETLKINSNIGLLFLNDWKWSLNKTYRIEKMSIEEIFLSKHYRLTLISSVVFYNCKESENEVPIKFINSNFIGFLYIIDVYQYKKEGLILYGDSINVGMDVPKGYNWFQAFVIDINIGLQYMQEVGFNSSTIRTIKSNLFKILIVHRYRILKAYSKLDGGLETWNIQKVNQLIFQYYIDDFYSFMYFIPYYLMPGFTHRHYLLLKKHIKSFIKKSK
jgi:abequosyltransferase